MAIKVQRTGDIEAPTFKALLLGPPGAGKTLFGKSWPDPLYLSAEGGLLSVRKYNLPYITITETGQMEEVLMHLRQAPEIRQKALGVPVKTVLVDTIDEISRYFVKERLATEHKEAMTQPDWGWLADQLRSITRGFRNLDDLHVIFTCHLKDQSDENSGETWVTPQLQGAYRDEITQAFDEVLLLKARTMTEVVDGKNVRKIVRTIQTYPDAKHDWVKDRSGTLPGEFTVDFETDFNRINSRILAGTAPTQADEVTPAPTAAPPDAGEATKTETKPAAKKATQAAKAAPKRTEASQSAPSPTPAPASDAEAETAVPPDGTPAEAPAEQTPGQVEQAAAEAADGLRPGVAEPIDAPCDECGTIVPADDRRKLRDCERVFKRVLCEKDLRVCEVCGGEIESVQRVELSGMRHRKRLCQTHFDAQKKAS